MLYLKLFSTNISFKKITELEQQQEMLEMKIAEEIRTRESWASKCEDMTANFDATQIEITNLQGSINKLTGEKQKLIENYVRYNFIKNRILSIKAFDIALT